MKKKYTKRQIEEAIACWEKQLKLAEARVQPSSTVSDPLPPMTREELRQIEEKFGTTGDFQESGWILPDGKLLQMRRTRERWVQHDFVLPPDGYYARAGIPEDADVS